MTKSVAGIVFINVLQYLSNAINVPLPINTVCSSWTFNSGNIFSRLICIRPGTLIETALKMREKIHHTSHIVYIASMSFSLRAP